MKVDVMLANSVVGAAERAQELEALGLDGAFSFENAHDLFLPLAAAAPATTRLELYTNVAIAFPRSPWHLANMAYDLQQMSQGRFSLGLGSQIRPHIEKRFGATWGKPVAHMREWVEATRAILEHWQHGTKLDFRGEYTTHTLSTPAFNPGPNPHGISKILVGALGPKMTQMVAEVADGILVMPFNSGRHMIERTVPAIQRGLDVSGRSWDDLEVTVEVICGVGRTDEELKAAMGVRNLVAFYGSTPSYRPVLEVEGRASLQAELNARSKAGDWAGMAQLIDDDLTHTIAVVGTPEQCAQEIVARYGQWADRVCCYFPGYTVADETIAELATAIREEAGKHQRSAKGARS